MQCRQGKQGKCDEIVNGQKRGKPAEKPFIPYLLCRRGGAVLLRDLYSAAVNFNVQNAVTANHRLCNCKGFVAAAFAGQLVSASVE